MDGVGICPWCGSFFRGITHCLRDGQALDPTDGVIDRYRIVDRVGEGGMGAIYKAEHTMLDNRVVALKLLHREHVCDQALVKRFFREAQAANKVDNEHIVEVLDFGSTQQGDSFLVMEYLDGPSLRDVVDAQAPLKLERAFSIGVQIAEALYAAHRQEIVHRDLKPENIVLVQGDEAQPEFVKLLDFGIAQLSDHLDARITRAGMILGTPAYMSPEQASGEPVDQRTDIYALGTILYEMLVGKVPFMAERAQDVLIAQLTKQPLPPKQLRPEIPSSVERVILRALNKDANQRPKTMMYLAYELRDALTRRTGMMPAITDIDDDALDVDAPADLDAGAIAPAPPGRRRQLLWGAGVAGGMALGVVVTLLAVGSNKEPAPTRATPPGPTERVRPRSDDRPAPGPQERVKVATQVTRLKQQRPKPASHRRPRTKRAAHAKVAAAPARAPSGKWHVTVRSVPAGANVADGRRRVGRTPVKVPTDEARTLTVFKDGYTDRSIKLAARQTGDKTVKLKKLETEWEVLSVKQLDKLRDSGQISRFTHQRRRRELMRARDAKLVRLRVDHKLGYYTEQQYQRQRQAIIDSYK